MSDQFCDNETAVIRAARSGKWEPTFRAHHDSCAVCREAAKLATVMSSLVVAEAGQIPPTPDAQRVWLKAAFAERQKRSVRISQLAGFVYAVLVAAIGVGAVSVLTSPFKSVAELVPSSGTSTTSKLSLIVMIVCILLVLFLSSPSARRSR